MTNQAERLRDYISGQIVPATPEERLATQVFSQRLVEDFGYPKGHIQTRPQFQVSERPSDERRGYPVDIAVFSSDLRIDDNLYMVVECKQPNRSEGAKQLKNYMRLSAAEIGIWFNGESHLYLHKTYRGGGHNTLFGNPEYPALWPAYRGYWEVQSR